MKKLLSLMLAVLLLILPVAGASAEGLSILDEMWALNDFSFLADSGILTEEEAELLAADRIAVESGRELVREAKITTGAITGVPEDDAALAALLERITLVSRSQRHEEHLEVLLDGEPLASFGYGEQDGLYGLSSNLLNGAVTLSAEDVAALPNRLLTAAQANGLITSQDAMQYGMMFATMSTSSYGTLLKLMQADPADGADLDLTAWNAVLSDVQGRMMYTAVTEQPADCDAAVEKWTLTVTAKDIRDFVVAGFRTVRDNPVLMDFMADLIGYEQMVTLYNLEGTFAEAVIDPWLAELEAAEQLIPANLDLTGYENEAGELVRLEILVLDASAQEKTPDVTIGTDSDLADLAELFGNEQPQPAVVLQFVYNRRTAEDAVTHELLFGDDRLEAYGEYIHAAGAYDGSHSISFGGVDEDGMRTKELNAVLDWRVSRSYGKPLTDVEIKLSIDGSQVKSSYCELTMSVSEEFVGMRCYAVRDTGMYVEYILSCDRSGVDLKGEETFRVGSYGELLLTCTADLRTQAPESSVFAGNPIRLNALTDDELAAWVGGVKETVEGWLAEVSAELPAFLTEPEDEPEDEELLRSERYGELPDGMHVQLDPPQIALYSNLSAGYDWEWEVLHDGEEENLRVISDYVSDFTPSYEGELVPPGSGGRYILTFEGLREGASMLCLTLRNHITGESEDVYVLLEVDAQGNVKVVSYFSMNIE